MNKKLFFLACLFSLKTFASGTLSVSPGYYLDTKKVEPTLGISVYEPIGLGLHYDSYTGGGVAPRLHSANANWFATRHDIETSFGDVTVSVGATLRLIFQENLPNENENNVHVQVSYKLW